MDMDINRIPVNVNDLTSALTERIGRLEQENALLKSQLKALLNVIPEDVWQALTNPKTDGE
ncbi:hypothetical protein ESN35_04955 [Bifidobacterium pullorum subsp. gallinarum]|uniref:Uncharacterized protein n=1 Tax=Bifidobacterium pullorum subsp. gallinarum TaxID=78344 RepID=A0A4P6DTM4_9BIFI|nr:hypothetical protein [Bifidobacterium pullorum]QAY32835.1 hypothetical protein ESN35_04955 [Bifidobacterium pullorum subsp. gallinarum]